MQWWKCQTMAASKQSITGGADVHHCNGDRLEQISVLGNIDSTREAPDAEEPKAQKAMNNADGFRAGDTPLEVERRRHAFRQQTMFNEALLHADESGNIDLDGLRAAMRKVDTSMKATVIDIVVLLMESSGRPL